MLLPEIEVATVMHLGLDRVHIELIVNRVVFLIRKAQLRIIELMNEGGSDLEDVIIGHLFAVGDAQFIDPRKILFFDVGCADADRTEEIPGSDFIGSNLGVAVQDDRSGMHDPRREGSVRQSRLNAHVMGVFIPNQGFIDGIRALEGGCDLAGFVLFVERDGKAIASGEKVDIRAWRFRLERRIKILHFPKGGFVDGKRIRRGYFFH